MCADRLPIRARSDRYGMDQIGSGVTVLSNECRQPRRLPSDLFNGSICTYDPIVVNARSGPALRMAWPPDSRQTVRPQLTRVHRNE